MSFKNRFSLSAIVLLTVGMVLAGVLFPVIAYQLYEDYRSIEISAEREGTAALDMLESVHAQAMSYRKQTEDNDPAIDTLNGTMEQFSEQSENVRLWLVMSQKVIDFQLENNQTEVEGPLDAVDQRAIDELTTQTEFADTGMLRITRPVIMGQGSASNEKCASCHTDLMGIEEGEPIGALSAEVNTQSDYLAWLQLAKNSIVGGILVILATLGLIYWLLGLTVLSPVTRLSEAATAMAQGKVNVNFEGENRPDALGKLAQSLNSFKISIKEHVALEYQAAHAKQLADAAKSSERAKSEFLANMSHEIRTPMNGVMGMAELLSKTSLDAKQTMFADVIVKSGAALLTIINDILDFSKIDAGQMELDPAPFKLKEAVEDVATLVSSGVAEKDLELIVRVEPSLPEFLIGDVGRIRQIMTNLLGNAVKFTEKGHVYINVKGGVTEEDGGPIARLYVTVEDTGIGIPEDRLSTIFQKFTQVDESATRRHQGTGLGLSISASLVEMMKGRIGVKSSLGEGSTFWFEITLPVHKEQIERRRVPIDVSGSRILLVDDNDVNRSILVELMDAWKFDSAAATSGSEALAVMKAAKAQDIRIDCVVMDYQMPDMSGAEAFKIMKADPELANIPVVMLTSVEELENGKPFSSLGVHGHLTKPARSSLLLETIIQILQDCTSGEVSKPREVIAGIEFARRIGNSRAVHTIDDSDWDKHLESEFSKNTEAESRFEAIDDDPVLDVLVCEDNEVNQIVFTQILEAANLKYCLANNGIEGLEIYQSRSPKLILMDVSMPGKNGLEATAEIRTIEEETGKHTPIIGVTAHAIKGDMEKCLAAGMDDYVSKPVSPDKLTSKLLDWMNKQSAVA